MSKRLKRLYVLPPDLTMYDVEWADDTHAIAKERRKWREKTMKRLAEIGKLVARDKVELAIEKFEERYNAAVEADRAESQRVFREAAETMRRRFHDAIEAAGKAKAKEDAEWRASVMRRLNASNVRLERIELESRGVVRGKRR